MIGDNLEQYTYKYLMSQALSFVDDSLDKREGSIIYDALAPACYVLAGYYMQLYQVVKNSFAVTATGEWLDQRVKESGITRREATAAVKRADFTDDAGQAAVVRIGTRWSTVSSTNPITYRVTAQYEQNGAPVVGAYELTCETLGTIGQEYTGPIIPVDFVKGVAAATMSTTLIPGRDAETDDELRERYFDQMSAKAFGGNISDYRNKTREIIGVGDLQIYPVWNGGGTVKLSIVDTAFRAASNEFVQEVQKLIDPVNASGVQGDGLGIAPIDHKVTVVAPEEVPVNITASIVLQVPYEVGQVQPAVEQAIEAYMVELRHDWATPNEFNEYALSVYASRITAAIVGVPGISNVTNVRLNGTAADITLQQTGQKQQIPVKGTVTLNV